MLRTLPLHFLISFFVPVYTQSQTTGRLARLWTVHRDQVDSTRVDDFERLVGTQAAQRRDMMKQNSLPWKAGYELSASGYQYMSFRPREGYAELDKRPDYPDAVKRQLAEKVSSMDDSIHGTLRAHWSEIWTYDESSSYFGTDTAAQRSPGFVYIRMEYIKPGMEHAYDSVTATFNKALKKINSPLSCLNFFSSYGDGSNYFVWLAASEAALSKGGSAEDILVKSEGKETAESLLKLWRDCLLQSDDLDAVPRRDLNALEDGEPWFGIH